MDKEITKDSFSCTTFLLNVHGCIQHKNIIFSIKTSSMHNLMNVNLDKILQVPTKNIQCTQVEGENVKIFIDLKISMDKYVLHSNFHVIDMDDVDIDLGCP
jgi:hypothetical protein